MQPDSSKLIHPILVPRSGKSKTEALCAFRTRKNRSLTRLLELAGQLSVAPHSQLFGCDPRHCEIVRDALRDRLLATQRCLLFRLKLTDLLLRMNAFLSLSNACFILVGHTVHTVITNGTHLLYLLSTVYGQWFKSLGVGNSFPFPHLSPTTQHPPGLSSNLVPRGRRVSW